MPINNLEVQVNVPGGLATFVRSVLGEMRIPIVFASHAYASCCHMLREQRILQYFRLQQPWLIDIVMSDGARLDLHSFVKRLEAYMSSISEALDSHGSSRLIEVQNNCLQ